MPITIIGNDDPLYPTPFPAPILETRDKWSDNWTFDPELTMVSAASAAGSMAVTTLEVFRKYGVVKMPYESNYAGDNGADAGGNTPRSAQDYTGKWIRMSIASDQGPTVAFVGRIESQSNELQGSPANPDADPPTYYDTPAGEQRWVASSGTRILQKIIVSQSYFEALDSMGKQLLDSKGNKQSSVHAGWLPAMNKKDARGFIVGNRSAAMAPPDPTNQTFGGTFVYGPGDSVWTHLDYLNYLIEAFVQQYDSDGNYAGPYWTITGQSTVLDAMTSSIEFEEAESALEMLKKLIPVKYGIDFSVRPTPESTPGAGDDGFEINIFSLTDQPQTFGTTTVDGNPNIVTVNRTQTTNMTDCRFVQSDDRRCDKVEVIGKRIVVCGTLQGADLAKRWSADNETDYKAQVDATDSSGITADDLRKREKFREVFQLVGASSTWNWGGGKWAIACNDDGTITTGPYQLSVKETLSWIPLKEGFDYSKVTFKDGIASGTDNTDGAENQQDRKPPMAWVYDGGASGNSIGYKLTESVKLHLSAPHHDWGLLISGNPNHILALNDWDATKEGMTSDVLPLYDYTKSVLTIAIESDNRIRIAQQVPAGSGAGDGSVMTIMDDEAELWIVLPGTIIDTDTQQKLVYFTGNKGQSSAVPFVLRNDIPRLSLVLAGAIARYINERFRSVLVFRGFLPWMSMVGSILTIIQEGDTQQRIGAVISSVEWTMGKDMPTTVVKAGYA